MFGAGIVTSIIGKLFGKTIGGAVETVVSKTGEVVQSGVSVVSKAMEDTGDTKSARSFGAPSEAGNGLIRQVADGINMLIRPVLAAFILGLIIGELTGKWHVSVQGLDNDVKTWFEWIMGFYFGQRAIVHDIPRLIKNLRAAFGKG